MTGDGRTWKDLRERVRHLELNYYILKTQLGEKWFPAFEASLIATLVERDLPYYQPAISKEAFDSMCRFAQTTGVTKGVGKYEDVVATQFSNLWKG